MECSICGISDKMRNVSQALASKGIVLVCDRCAQEEGLILLKKPKIIEPGKEKQETMYERMARLAGVQAKAQPERPWLRTQEKNLREIVDKNYERKIKQEALILKPRPDLVDNFHWILMRVRRVKGLTQGQLAERISEPEAAVKMAEQGVVPEGYALIDKLERFLKVRLIKERNLSLPVQKQQHHLNQQLHNSNNHRQDKEAPRQQQQSNEKNLAFDKHSLASFTIADLKRIWEEKEPVEESAEEEIERKENYEQSKPYDRLDYE